MNESFLKKYWYDLFNDLKERWPDLTQSDIDYVAGDVRKLLEVVQKRRHISAVAAQHEVDDFFRRLQIHRGSPEKTVRDRQQLDDRITLLFSGGKAGERT